MANREQQTSPEGQPHQTEPNESVRADWANIATNQCEILSTARHLSRMLNLLLSSGIELNEDDMEAISWLVYVQNIALDNVQANHALCSKGAGRSD